MWQLPCELLFMVVKELDPISSVCFALSCKQALQTTFAAKGPWQIPSVKKHHYLGDCKAVLSMQRLLWPIDRIHEAHDPVKGIAICRNCCKHKSTKIGDYDPQKITAYAAKRQEIRKWCSKRNNWCPDCISGRSVWRPYPDFLGSQTVHLHVLSGH